MSFHNIESSKSAVYLAWQPETEPFMGEDRTCSTVTRRVNSVPRRRCSGKSSKDSLFSSFSSASACTRVSTSFSASSSATLCPKHCWQSPVLESAKLETSNNSEHAGALCVAVSWRKREMGKGAKTLLGEVWSITTGKRHPGCLGGV